jgi:hypothetical protein
MARRTSRARRAQRGDRWTGLVLAVLAVVLLAGLGGTYWWVKNSKIVIDAQTNCPRAGPRGVHVIIIDRSDPISQQQAQIIRQRIQALKIDAPLGLRFDVYTFEGDTKNVLEPILKVCSSGKPEEANEWIENPEFVRRQYEERFSSVLDRTIDGLLQEATRDSSPIIESLRAAAITSFGAFESSKVPLRLTLISDMVQHTQLSSHIRAEPNFSLLSKNPTWGLIRPNLNRVETEILYLLRPTAVRAGRPIQNRGHQMFWEELISGSGGRLNKIEPF